MDDTPTVPLLFLEGLQALALAAADQVRVSEPGCVTCELTVDFDAGVDQFFSECRPGPREREAVVAVQNAIAEIPEDDFECWEPELLGRPSWQKVRLAAARALAILGLPFDAPPEFVRVSHDVFVRGGR